MHLQVPSYIATHIANYTGMDADRMRVHQAHDV